MCRQFHLAGFKIQKIVSRKEVKGRALACSCDSTWSTDYDFSGDEDVIITAVPDDLLPEVLEKIKSRAETVIAHTAGSIGLDVFPEHIDHKAVFYPLQTFSENRKIQFKDLPLFIEASDSYSEFILKVLAESIGGKVYFTDMEHRRLLHVAAVFVSNFTNYMLTSGKRVSEKAGLAFEVLIPLINETFRKAMDIGPEESQTGPAFRYDIGTINKHLDLLSFSPDLQRVYSEVTESIIQFYKKH